ncbi:hypothetical protein QO259_05705 [Salinicola sp. JS01]|uniref:hypothetical protein n=1 Tax=Salinicola sp. JS01 TaxID=3050071 RepID=UPI00255C270D|nr:hypothetical protein [Salinicola sp. JS01]WIX34158.1 hypothetical protein QO259_05705 [Salinicola sp. JS01]
MNHSIYTLSASSLKGLIQLRATFENGDRVLCVTRDLNTWLQFVERDGICTVQLLSNAGASGEILSEFPE